MRKRLGDRIVARGSHTCESSMTEGVHLQYLHTNACSMWYKHEELEACVQLHSNDLRVIR